MTDPRMPALENQGFYSALDPRQAVSRARAGNLYDESSVGMNSYGYDPVAIQDFASIKSTMRRQMIDDERFAPMSDPSLPLTLQQQRRLTALGDPSALLAQQQLLKNWSRPSEGGERLLDHHANQPPLNPATSLVHDLVKQKLISSLLGGHQSTALNPDPKPREFIPDRRFTDSVWQDYIDRQENVDAFNELPNEYPEVPQVRPVFFD